MQIQARVHALKTAVLDNVAQGLDRALVVIAHGNCLSLRIHILLIGHEYRHLGAELGELEWT